MRWRRVICRQTPWALRWGNALSWSSWGGTLRCTTFGAVMAAYSKDMYQKINKVLSSGMVATIFLSPNDKDKSYMNVSFVIGKSIRANKDWFLDKHNYRGFTITGDGTMEGLSFALEFIKNYKGKLIVEYPDDKRKRAYRRLLSYGFREGYFTSNPDWKFYYRG